MSVDIHSQIREQLDSSASDGAEESKSSRPSAAFFLRASRTEVAGFFRELAILLRAGYTAPRALRLLATTLTNKDLASAVEAVAEQTDSGVDFSRALGSFPWYFDEVTASVVEASERSGRLPEGAAYLADLMEEDGELRDRIGNAVAYPVVLLGLGALVVFTLLVFVVPTFAGFVLAASGEASLDGAAGVVHKLSMFVRSPLGMFLVPAAIVGAVVALVSFRASNPEQFDRMVGRVPVFGRIMVFRALTRFTSTLRMLTVNGVALRDALRLARGSLQNNYLEGAVDDMVEAAEAGRNFVEPLLEYRQVPPVFIDMLAVGVESGELPEMLHHLTQSMRSRLFRTTDRIMVLLQPLLLIGMGAIVICMFLFFFFPYFDLLMEVSRPT